jgi:glucans biosynthesis protein C
MFLTFPAIYHHTAIAHGGVGSWLFTSQCFPELDPILITFKAVNQSFFMAVFFWIAGVFTSIELSHSNQGRSALWKCLESSARRLLVPILLLSFLLAPMMITIAFVWQDSLEERSPVNVARSKAWHVTKFFLVDIVSTRGSGDQCGSALFCSSLMSWPQSKSGCNGRRRLIGWRIPRPRNSKSNFRVLLIVILTSWIIRTMHPVGSIIGLLNAQPAFLPQYIYAYVLGHLTGNGAIC